MDIFHGEQAQRLFKALALLDDPADCAAFIEDLCTITELRDMAQRLETALLLSKGQNYQTISKNVGVSTTTISRVSRCLNYGAGGYVKVLEKLRESEEDDERGI